MQVSIRGSTYICQQCRSHLSATQLQDCRRVATAYPRDRRTFSDFRVPNPLAQPLRTDYLKVLHASTLQNYDLHRHHLRQRCSGTDGRHLQCRPFAAQTIQQELSPSPIRLNPTQLQMLRATHRVKKRLSVTHSSLPSTNGTKKPTSDEITIEDLLKMQPRDGVSAEEDKVLEILPNVYAGKTWTEVKQDLSKAISHRNPAQSRVVDEETLVTMKRIGLFDLAPTPVVKSKRGPTRNSRSESRIRLVESKPSKLTRQPRKSLLAGFTTRQTKKSKSTPEESVDPAEYSNSAAKLSEKNANRSTVHAASLRLEPITMDNLSVPQLSFDLARVLFNPGVYHLQDPRSRVYNFDPYLEQPMSLTEFNFDALNAYVTSSEDRTLLSMAKDHGKRYIGSSSSMSGALSQFHFLVSQMRPLQMNRFSKGFQEQNTNFSQLSRTASAMFLRYRDGIYAVDADKEYDEPNVLMSMGKSLEKLMTLEKSEFEKWRRKGTPADLEFKESHGEAFHYSGQGAFLMRSQLDAYDPRLPGTGVFDLKTRAVAGIRLNIANYEDGMNYQIKNLTGTWESYEREYYDMMRSTFLKYSMQVRLGRMDGIFVAYHNIQRIFGFQYIPLSEMDEVMHGQTDPCLGDQEFRFSINFLSEIFDMATTKFPQQSLRIHLDTREATARNQQPYMHVFIEPWSEEEISTIQKRASAELEAFERRTFLGEGKHDDSISSDVDGNFATLDQALGATRESSDSEPSTDPAIESDPAEKSNQAADASTTQADSAASSEFLDEVFSKIPEDRKPTEPRPVLAYKLTLQNKINGVDVARVDNISDSDEWSIDYRFEQLSDHAARKEYVLCKNRRMAALSSAKLKSSYFLRKIKALNETGAAWRERQDRLDEQRGTTILYPDKVQ